MSLSWTHGSKVSAAVIMKWVSIKQLNIADSRPPELDVSPMKASFSSRKSRRKPLLLKHPVQMICCLLRTFPIEARFIVPACSNGSLQPLMCLFCPAQGPRAAVSAKPDRVGPVRASRGHPPGPAVLRTRCTAADGAGERVTWCSDRMVTLCDRE